MELILHYMYVNAIKDVKAWKEATPVQLSMIGFWNLIIVWLKVGYLMRYLATLADHR
jgi:D-alanyl-lipoteichoic acid acyltransferase DltB (MBOAT superfamily)